MRLILSETSLAPGVSLGAPQRRLATIDGDYRVVCGLLRPDHVSVSDD